MIVPASVAALAKVTSKETTRYAFNGIHFERGIDGKARAMATDGRRAVIFDFTETPGSDYPPTFEGNDKNTTVNGFMAILPVKAVQDAAKAAPKMPRKPVLHQRIVIDEPSANGTVKIGSNNLDRKNVLEAQSIDGRFPSVDDVMPKDQAIIGIKPFGPAALEGVNGSQPEKWAVKVRVNAKYLRELADAVSQSAGCECIDLTIPVAYGRPIQINSVGAMHGKSAGLLMPVTDGRGRYQP